MRTWRTARPPVGSSLSRAASPAPRGGDVAPRARGLLVGGEAPAMPEGVLEESRAISVELIGDGPQALRGRRRPHARRTGPRPRRTRGSSPESRPTLAGCLMFISGNSSASMMIAPAMRSSACPTRPSGCVMRRELGRCERLLVEVDRGGSVADREVRGSRRRTRPGKWASRPGQSSFTLVGKELATSTGRIVVGGFGFTTHAPRSSAWEAAAPATVASSIKQTAPAVLDLEAARRAHVEREHAVVRVPAEVHGERHSLAWRQSS